MTHLLIPTLIGGSSILIFIGLLIFESNTRPHPISYAIRHLAQYLYLGLSGSLLIFSALPEYSFIMHFAFKTSAIPLMAGILYALTVSLIYMDPRENSMRDILTNILVLLCLAMLPVLLVGAIPYNSWMAPVAALILVGDIITTQVEKNRKKRLATETSAT